MTDGQKCQQVQPSELQQPQRKSFTGGVEMVPSRWLLGTGGRPELGSDAKIRSSGGDVLIRECTPDDYSSQQTRMSGMPAMGRDLCHDFGELATRTCETGADETGLGWWAYMLFKGQNGCTTRIISAYQPNHSQRCHLNSIYSQHL